MGKDKIRIDLVYKLLKQVPKGRVTTYKALARAAGHPAAARAVGGIMRRNPYAPAVPCHRVVYSDGRLGGFGGSRGVEAKAELLEKEGVKVKDGRLVDFANRYFDAFSVHIAEKSRLP
ncbi:MAG: MGMT family protein [Candidatus Brockarchaeota archaeon]|nr:MGMT family protein [Candidatus Brockarchaeota archaeon]